MDLVKIRRQILAGTIYREPRYKRWRKKVYERDNFTCRICGRSDVYLNAHHIKTKYKNTKLIFTVSNGITLCVADHKKVTGCEEDYVRYFRGLLKLKPTVSKTKKKISKKKKIKNLRRICR